MTKYMQQVLAVKERIGKSWPLRTAYRPEETDLTYGQVSAIIWGLDCGLTSDQLAPYATPAYDPSQLYLLIHALQQNFSPEQMAIISTPTLTPAQMNILETAIYQRLDNNQLQHLASLNLEPPDMLQALDEIVEENATYLRSKYPPSPYQRLTADYITLDQNDALAEIREAWEELSTHYHLSAESVTELMIAVDSGLNDFELQYLANPEYTPPQIQQLRHAFVDGLPYEQIDLFTDPALMADQMQEIRQGINDGLTLDQILIYADPKISSSAMSHIRKGLIAEAAETQSRTPIPSPSLEM